jgi:hypothetical protein
MSRSAMRREIKNVPVFFLQKHSMSRFLIAQIILVDPLGSYSSLREIRRDVRIGIDAEKTRAAITSIADRPWG